MSETQPVEQGQGPAEHLKDDSGALRLRPQLVGSYTRPDVPRPGEVGDVVEERRRSSGLRELIQFFRKAPPPPTNFMSIPDDFSTSSEEDKWGKFKTRVFRRSSSSRRSRKRRPPVIMLPDSAVAARTTGGHRYIAISIPTEHSPLAPLSGSQYPVYDSVEAAFQREVNSRFGMWKNPPAANRPVTVLNPVPEDLRESMSFSSLPSTAPERHGHSTALPSRAMRNRPHTVSLLPSREQRYTPRKSRRLTKCKSTGDARAIAEASESTLVQYGHDGQPIPISTTSDTGRDISPEIGPKDTDTAKHSTSRAQQQQQQPSSRRTKQLQPAAPDTAGTSQLLPFPGTDEAYSTDDGNMGGGMSSRPRGSVAASIETAGYSPQLMKAQTAIAFHSVPIVGHSSAADDDLESPLDLNFPQPPSSGKTSEQAASAEPPPLPPPRPRVVDRSRSRKQRVHEKKQRDTEKLRSQIAHEDNDDNNNKKKEKGKAPETQPFETLPSAAVSGHEHDNNSSTSASSPQDSSSSSSHSYSHTARRREEEREARQVARVLAEGRDVLERLPREELISRYEALREHRIYERERRLRRLEHSRDTWVRAVPVLLQDLNGLLREQRRVLEEGTRLGPRASSPARQPEHHHRPRGLRRRSRSAGPLIGAPGLEGHGHGLDPLKTRRSRSLDSGPARVIRSSSKVRSG
ncbi:hypothetical protein F4777DRAFT_585196 [Nemania sp. FL0916]|nr:hypothetical protein F4777DRAFT_585196 [Nemania sp. FL0916]